MSTMFSQFGIDRPWCDSLKEEALLWRSSKHLRFRNFDQRCNVNLIRRRVILRIVLLEESAVDWHHERIAVWNYEAVCSIWVDWLYYKWSFPFGLKLFFCLMCHNHRSSDSWNKIVFLENLFSDFLVEGSENLSLTELDLLFGLQTFII